MTSTREKGVNSEEIAVEHLVKNGYMVMERNWYSSHHEIDIIAVKDNVLVVIEVKSLFSNYIQEPYKAVNRNKQQMIISAANAYIRQNNVNNEVRFDVISILLSTKEPIIEHIENAFYPRVR